MISLKDSRWLLLTITLLWFQYSTALAGVITNGSFSSPIHVHSPFPGWTTDDSFGFVAPVDGGGAASFTIEGFFDDPVNLFQKFSLPTGATALSFEYRISSDLDGSQAEPFAASDSFQASLYRASDFVPQFPTVPGIFDAFYAIDAVGFELFSAGVSLENLVDDWKRVTLNLASLPADDYIIDFLLLGDDDGLVTTVLLDNVMVARSADVVPEPASLALWIIFATALVPLSRRSRFSVANL